MPDGLFDDDLFDQGTFDPGFFDFGTTATASVSSQTNLISAALQRRRDDTVEVLAADDQAILAFIKEFVYKAGA